MVLLGIVGAGRLGSFHTEKASKHANVKLVGLQDPCQSRRQTLAAKYGIADFENTSDLIQLVDAVVIASPTQFHHALGMQFLSAGKHVLMEKPLAYTANDAKELVDTAARNNVILQVGHVEQFNPAWTAAAPVLNRVKSGDRAVFTAQRTSGYTFRSTDIGVVHDLMVHDLDLVLSVVPSPIRSIDAAGFHLIASREQGGNEDIAYARILFENGTVANFYASRADQTAKRIMQIQLAHTFAEIDFASRQTRIVQAREGIISGKFSPKQIGDKDPNDVAKNFMQEQFSTTQVENDAVDALSLEMDDFVQAIQCQKNVQVPGSRALQAVAAADAIVQALSAS